MAALTSPLAALSPATVQALGWALLHFLWQGAGVAALAALLMRACATASQRYCLGVGALILMLAMPAITLLLFPARLALSLSVPLPRLPPPPDLLPWLVQCWLMGVLLLSLRLAGGSLLLGQRQRGRSRPAGGELLALCVGVQQRLGLSRPIRYLECGWLAVPAVIGCLRPAVLLPLAALTGLSEAQLRAVIAHELAHVRRWDPLVNLLQVLAETLLFYHPAVWWLNARIRTEREICCDEIAVAEAGDRIAYARALMLMARLGSGSGFQVAATDGILAERIFHIFGHGRSRKSGLAASLSLLLAAMAALAALVPPAPQLSAIHDEVRSISSNTVAAVERPLAAPAPDGVVMLPKRLVQIRALRRPRIPSLPLAMPVDLATVTDSDSRSAPIAPQTEAPAPELIAVSAERRVAPSQYPASVFTRVDSRTWTGFHAADVVDFCRDFAVQTVTQGANRPMPEDEAVKQRLVFFALQCVTSNGVQLDTMSVTLPVYDAVGTASPVDAANVSGTWTLINPGGAGNLEELLAQRTEPKTCSFRQTQNSISGSCTGLDGSGPLTGVVDGRQVRWVWKLARSDGRPDREIDFIGMKGADGTISGQSIVPGSFSPYQLESFTATSAQGRVASGK